jgi:hypothetical protein
MDDIKQEITKNVAVANGWSSAMIQRIDEDLQFAGGNQYSDADKKMWGDGRAQMVLNLIRQNCNQIVNPYRANPFGINVTSKYAAAQQKAEIANALIRAIEEASGAKKVYTLAIDRQVKAGRGYLAITTDYAGNDSFDQLIKIIGIPDPTMVIFDPFSREVDGSDAQWAVLVEHISEMAAENRYGWDKNKRYGAQSLLQESRWQAPDGSVEVCTYFRLKKTQTKIYQDGDGKVLQEGQVRKNNKLKARSVSKTIVEVYRFVCDEQIGEMTTMSMSNIPIYPVLGEMIDLGKGKVDFVGLVHFGRDPAKMVNWAANQTAEKLAIAPKATTYVDWRSIVRHKEVWNASSRINPPYLPWDSVSPDGKDVYQPPQDRQSNVDVSSSNAAQANYQQLLSTILGINPAGSNVAGAGNETAASVLTRGISADLSNFQYSDNLATTIKAMGKGIIELAPNTYDTPRLLRLIDAKGQATDQEMNIAELDIKPSMLDVDVDAGPMLASRKREARSQLVALGSIVGPEAALVFASDIIRSTEMPDAEAIASKVDIFAQTKLGLAQPGTEQDPEAVAALQAAQTTIDTLTQQLQETWRYAQGLEQQVLSSEQDNKTKLVIAAENNASKERIAAINQQGELTKTQMELVAESDLVAQQAQADLAKIDAEAPPPTIVVAGAKPVLKAVGGTRSRMPF